jgi:NAD+ synthase (glutamine-hydrolysing)
VRLALAQINTVVGDLHGNRAKILARLADARDAGADLVLFPELATTGYPPEDLLLRAAFLRAADESLAAIAAETNGIAALVGTPHHDGRLFNACAVCAGGEVKALYRKHLLPNYGVFDEDRYFEPGDELVLLGIGDTVIGPTICEDIWLEGPPITDLVRAGAQVITNLSASPFHLGKGMEREEMLVKRARDNDCWVVLVNAVGGQDELVFDGHSVVIAPGGEVVARAPSFEEALLVADLEAGGTAANVLSLGEQRAQSEPVAPALAEPLSELEQMRLALELGLRDYLDKNGFHEVVVGLSGGIDSALTAALAAEALGPERVVAVSMPSRYSSAETRADAQRLAGNLGVRYLELPIEGVVEAVDGVLAEPFAGTESGLAEENVQARIRGLLLMALSNKFGWLVVATGNKSELAVGYATLYGDMAGGFALLKDVFKTDVFRLARHLNERAGRELVPQSIIDRAPSAELRPDQRDEDSLPPYAELDKVLEAYVEQDRSREELIADGFDAAVVERTVAMVDRAEYKRRQAPPGVKLRTKAFGRDRRTPITNRWKG